ncbi:MAG: Rid family detoxifying hydrolase [Pseudomonadota bacterium]
MMSKQTFAPHPTVPLSNAVRAGDFVFTSGQVPFGPDGKLVEGGIDVQTKTVLDNLAAALGLAGATLNDVVKTTIWLTDAADFAEFNSVYASYFETPPPARSCVVSALMVPARVEIEAVAYRPE